MPAARDGDGDGPSINVWTLGRGPRGQWTLQHTTADIDDATALFAELEKQGLQVALYELGLFAHEGRQVAGQVGFWWSANLNGYMQMEPEGRGAGWSDDFDAYVEYLLPEPSAGRSVTAGTGPWTGAQAAFPTMTRPQDSPEVGTLEPSYTDEARVRRNQTLWALFVLPGKIALWVEYMFPSKGQVWASSRRYGNPLVEVMYAAVFWVIAVIFLIAWAGQGR